MTLRGHIVHNNKIACKLNGNWSLLRHYQRHCPVSLFRDRNMAEKIIGLCLVVHLHAIGAASVGDDKVGSF